MLRRLFVSARKPAPHSLEDVGLLERTAHVLPADQRANVLCHAADLYLRIGEPARALTAYGGAIDGYLEGGQFTAAAAVCRSVIELYPGVVRARGTLAFLSLGLRLGAAPAARAIAETGDELDSYLSRTRTAGQAPLASRRLRLLAPVTGPYEIQELISDLLLELGDPGGAEEVFLAAYEERDDIRARRVLQGTQSERWARVLRQPLTPARSLPAAGA